MPNHHRPAQVEALRPPGVGTTSTGTSGRARLTPGTRTPGPRRGQTCGTGSARGEVAAKAGATFRSSDGAEATSYELTKDGRRVDI